MRVARAPPVVTCVRRHRLIQHGITKIIWNVPLFSDAHCKVFPAMSSVEHNNARANNNENGCQVAHCYHALYAVCVVTTIVRDFFSCAEMQNFFYNAQLLNRFERRTLIKHAHTIYEFSDWNRQSCQAQLCKHFLYLSGAMLERRLQAS